MVSNTVVVAQETRFVTPRYESGFLGDVRTRQLPWAGIGAEASRFAPLPLRLIAGVGFMIHGWPKLFDPAAHQGLAGMLGGMHIPAAGAVAWLVGVLEFFGGLALVLGAFTGLVAMLFVIEMFVASLLVHAGNGFLALHPAGEGPEGPLFAKPGVEVPFLYAGIALALLLAGPGALAVDNWIAQRKAGVR